MNSSTHCPACNDSQTEQLEALTVAAQHQLYAPDDRCMQDMLTGEAEKAATQYEMLRCRACGLEFASPLRAPGDGWYRLAYKLINLYPEARWEFEIVLKRFSGKTPVLELGCGSGGFLRRCKDSGISAMGVDFSADAIEACEAAGLDARKLDVLEPVLNVNDPRPRHIVAFHVLEHLDNPRALFEQAATAAAMHSELWIAVPSCRRATRKYGVTDFLDQPPHHMTRWTPRALAALGQSTSWRLERMFFEPLQFRMMLGTIACNLPGYIQRKDAGELADPSIERRVRIAHYPAAILRRLTIDRDISGFTMLAHFRRGPTGVN